jgi:cytochrome b
VGSSDPAVSLGALALGVAVAIVSARLGEAAMTWHLRFGRAIPTLASFRLAWGFVGGRGSRCRSHVGRPAATLRYRRGRSLRHEHRELGQTPLGAWSALVLPATLSARVATGLIADDEIASSGPLVRYVGDPTSVAASHWHRLYGQWIIVVLVLAHVAAIALGWPRRRRDLLGPMRHDDEVLAGDVPAARDTPASRPFALGLATGRAIAAAQVVRLGG